jgi:lysophospholipase L1-like esterase
MLKHLARLVLGVSALVLASCATTSPTVPTPTVGSVVRYTALGASDAIGYGGSVVCIPFTACPNGTGYIQLATRRLQADGRTVTLVNLGVPGAVLSPEIQAIGNAMGRGILTNLVQNERPFIPTDTTFLTIFIGGNDANTIGAAADTGFGGADPSSYIQTQIQNFGTTYRELVTDIKSKAPQARIVVLNLPNLAAMPYAAGYSLAQRRGLQQIAVGLSAQMNALSSQGVVVLDLMCDPLFYQPQMLSSDGFHPSDAGYTHMADLVLTAATGTPDGPRASCSQMTLF